MSKTILVWLLATFFLATVSLADAQQLAKIPRIGFVSSAGNSKNPGPRVQAFQRGLRELGYLEGKNIQVEYRYLEGKPGTCPELCGGTVAAQGRRPGLHTLGTVRVAKQATHTIPIVMVITDDPVALGLVDSLARPGGNITGLTRLSRDLSGKRLELLTEAVPGTSRVGVLYGLSSESANTLLRPGRPSLFRLL